MVRDRGEFSQGGCSRLLLIFTVLGDGYTNSLTVQVALQDQWKKANYDANAKKAKEPAKNPKEAHD